MAAATFDKALSRLLAHEGGYSNHPSDPGGPTNFGITLADFRKYINPNGTAEDVRNMRIDQARNIYRLRYWDTLRCDALPAGLDDCLFDYGVNSGVARAGKVLRAVLGLPTTTWAVTEEVIEAARKRDAKALIQAVCDERLRFLKGLRTWPVFGRGWERRVNEVRNFDLKLAAAPAVQAAPPKPDPEKAPVGKGVVPLPNVIPAPKTTATATVTCLAAAWQWVAANPWEAAAMVAGVIAATTLLGHVLRQRARARQEIPVGVTP